MNTFQHFDSCPLQNSNWGRGGIFYHFMANTLATQDLQQNGQDFTTFTTWAQIKVEWCVWNTRRGMGGGEVNCWIMLALEGQGCSYSALGCEHQEHTERGRESNNKIEPIKYSQPAQIQQQNIFHLQVKSWRFENTSIFIRHLNWRVPQCQGSINFVGMQYWGTNLSKVYIWEKDLGRVIWTTTDIGLLEWPETWKPENYPHVLKFVMSSSSLIWLLVFQNWD